MRTVDPERHAARRRRILDAAAACIAEKGYQRATTADICARAGVSSGALFHYFGSKRDVFRGIFEADREDARALLKAAGREPDPLAAVLDVVTALARPATEPGAAALGIELVVQAQRDPELADLIARNDDETRSGLAELVRRAQAAGRCDPGLDAAVVGRWLGLLVDGLFLQASGDPAFADPGQLEMLRLVVTRMLVPGGEPGAGGSPTSTGSRRAAAEPLG